jgi:ABC-type uncharacterized transport system permease subunit
MDLTITILTWLLPLLYLAVMVEHGLAFTLRVRADSRSLWLVLIVLLNVAYLALRTAAGQGAPLGTPPTIPAILALSIAAVYAIVELITRDRRTGVFVLAVVFLFQYTASMLFSTGGVAGWEAMKMQSPWAGLHVILALLAYTALALAAVYGLLYISVGRSLKRHYFGVLYDRLPPLAVLGHMTWHALLTGFVCMTIALAAAPLLHGGPGEGASLHGLSPRMLAKIVIGLVVWVIYAVAIFGKVVRKWEQARISFLALLGFAIVTALLVVSAILSEPAV